MNTEAKKGGCQCGKIRYALSGEPVTCYACHCTDCQTQSGAGFSLSMIVPLESLTVIQGEPAKYRRHIGERHSDQRFCSECGTRLWGNGSRAPDLAFLKPGTLDDTSWVEPIAHVWTRSAQPWVKFASDTVMYETQPEDLQELTRLWRERGA